MKFLFAIVSLFLFQTPQLSGEVLRDLEINYVDYCLVCNGVPDTFLALFPIPYLAHTIKIEIASKVLLDEQIPVTWSWRWNNTALVDIIFTLENENTSHSFSNGTLDHTIDRSPFEIQVIFICNREIEERILIPIDMYVLFGAYDPIGLTLKKECGVYELPQGNSSMEAEIAAVASVYLECGGEDWRDTSYWLNGEPCQQGAKWYGISCGEICIDNCDSENRTMQKRVTLLDFDQQGLIGTFPERIFTDVPFLQKLLLSDNDVTVHFPPAICDLRYFDRLNYRWVTRAPEIGPLPDCIFNIPKLYQFHLTNAGITGPMPPISRNSTSLTSIQLFDNYLTGVFPVLEGNLSESKLLYVTGANNLFTSISPRLHDLPWLSTFDFSGNLITEIPPTFWETPETVSFVRLRGSYNRFNGMSLHPSLALFPSLKHFECIDCGIQGTLEEIDWTIPPLIDLDLSLNDISGTIPPEIFTKPTIEGLKLSNNRLSGKLSQNTFAGELVYVDLSFNQLEGPVIIRTTPSLAIVNIGHNQFTELRIDFMPSLTNFIASNNRFSGPLLIDPTNNFDNDLQIGRSATFPNLLSFDVENNLFTGIIPCKLMNEQNKNLRYLFFSNNPDMQWEPSECDTNISKSLKLPVTIELADKTLGDSVRNDDGHYSCRRLSGSTRTLTITLDPSYYDYLHCACLPEWYGSGANCSACHPGMYCPGGADVLILSGYFPQFKKSELFVDTCTAISGTFSPCNDGILRETVVGLSEGDMDYPELFRAANGTGLNVRFKCHSGFGGRKCSKCANGWFQLSGKCYECPTRGTSVYAIIVVFSLVLMALIGIGMALKHFHDASGTNGNERSSGISKILLLHIQLLAVIFANIPPESAGWVHQISQVVLFEPFGLECAGLLPESGFKFTFYFMLFLPIFCCLQAYITTIFVYLFGRRKVREKLHRLKFIESSVENSQRLGFRRRFTMITLTLLMAVYLPVARTILSTLNCNDQDISTDEWFLVATPWVRCIASDQSVDTVWAAMLGWAIVGVLVFLIGFWFFLAKLIYQFETTEGRDRGFSVMFKSDPDLDRFHRRWTLLIILRDYKDQSYGKRIFYYWILIELFLKLAVACLSLTPDVSTITPLLMTLILLWYLMLLMFYQPYKHATTNFVAILSQILVLASLLMSALVIQVPSDNSKRWTNGILSVVFIINSAMILLMMWAHRKINKEYERNDDKSNKRIKTVSLSFSQDGQKNLQSCVSAKQEKEERSGESKLIENSKTITQSITNRSNPRDISKKESKGDSQELSGNDYSVQSRSESSNRTEHSRNSKQSQHSEHSRNSKQSQHSEHSKHSRSEPVQEIELSTQI